tara:strand:+ start:632 stop:1024 length:393 start_codon:yes stop_codon:yes gene_type:complete
MEKQYDHDYLFKVNNDEEGWERINQIRKDSKACKSNYKLVLRGSKPTTRWGSRPSIPLSEAQVIRVYVRPKETDQQRMDRATSQREDWLLEENLKLREKLRDMEANQSTFNEILRLREKAERLSRELGID